MRENRMRMLVLWAVLALVACGSSGDDDGGGDVDASLPGPGGFECSGKPSTFSGDVWPIVMTSCAGREGCHGPIFQMPSTAYDFLAHQPASECSDGRRIVSPGHPESSYVVDKLTDTALCGDGVPMPKSGLAPGAWTPLPDAQIQAIYDWICLGAKDD
jgi:hypothetical protein